MRPEPLETRTEGAADAPELIVSLAETRPAPDWPLRPANDGARPPLREAPPPATVRPRRRARADAPRFDGARHPRISDRPGRVAPVRFDLAAMTARRVAPRRPAAERALMRRFRDGLARDAARAEAGRAAALRARASGALNALLMGLGLSVLPEVARAAIGL